jgi:hypothetical protein
MACRVCTANDRDALVEELAAEFWKGSCAGPIDGRPWEQAGAYWHAAYRKLADKMVAIVEEELR